MRITKSMFVESIRCEKFCALNDLYRTKNLTPEQLDRMYEVLNASDLLEDESIGYDNDGINIEDYIDTDLEHLHTMMPYYSKIEELCANLVKEKFGGKLIYSLEYGKQKEYFVDIGKYELFCYVDIYNRLDELINIIEVKATTTRKFSAIKYTHNKEKYNLFIKRDNGVYCLAEVIDPSVLEIPKYIEKRNQLLDRTKPCGVYVYDLAFQRYIIEQSNQTNADNYYLGVLNHEYVFDGEYIDSKPNYKNDVMALIDLNIITEMMQDVIGRDVDKVLGYFDDMSTDFNDIGNFCKKPRPCLFQGICNKHLPKKNSLLQYLSSHCGFKDEVGEKHDQYDLVNEGHVHMLDIPRSWLQRKNNIIQYDVVKNKKTYINKDKMDKGIKEIKYPIYHLDFESFPCPLPRFKGEQPYMQSVFQYSLHIEKTAGVCDKDKDHFEFLAKDHSDNRYDLVKSMCDNILDDGGSVMVYNASFERTRLNEFKKFFPDYADRLDIIIDRLFDLMWITKGTKSFYLGLGFSEEEASSINYYHENLKGSYSIKKFLPLFSDLTYEGMVVGNGLEAVYAYAKYDDLSPNELIDLQNALIKYCKQDTWAMVAILGQLRKAVTQ